MTTKEQLLVRAMDKPVRKVWQIDVFGGFPPGESGYGALPEIVPDDDGQIVYGPNLTDELMAAARIRVQIPEGLDTEEAIVGLRKAIDLAERYLDEERRHRSGGDC